LSIISSQSEIKMVSENVDEENKIYAGKKAILE
jgi:hypothetical protein